nr:alpha/beta hydrolase [uncultured Caldimonas sp.]
MIRRLTLALAAVAGLALAVAACSPLATLNALVPGSTHVLRADLAYGPHARHRLDLYLPRGKAGSAGGHPVVVFFYGGSWNTGDRADYRFVGEALASRGIAVAIADYRLYPEVRFPDFLHDSARAVAWVLKQSREFGGDPGRVFVMGHSAGAYNAAMVALDARWLARWDAAPSSLAGWIGLAGPYDFLPIVNPDVKPVFHHPDYPPDTQPLALASAESPPAFLGAAADDDLVNPQRSTVQLAQRLESLAVPVRSKLYEGVSHTTLLGALARPLRFLAPVLEDVAGFVQTAEPRS